MAYSLRNHPVHLPDTQFAPRNFENTWAKLLTVKYVSGKLPLMWPKYSSKMIARNALELFAISNMNENLPYHNTSYLFKSCN